MAISEALKYTLADLGSDRKSSRHMQLSSSNSEQKPKINNRRFSNLSNSTFMFDKKEKPPLSSFKKWVTYL